MIKASLYLFILLIPLLSSKQLLANETIFGTVVKASGNVFTKTQDKLLLVRKGYELPLKTSLVTKSDSSLTIMTPDHHFMTIGPNTLLHLQHHPKRNINTVNVKSGEFSYKGHFEHQAKTFIFVNEAYYSSQHYTYKKGYFNNLAKGKILKLRFKKELETGVLADITESNENKDENDEFAHIFDTQEESMPEVDDNQGDKTSQIAFTSRSSYYFSKPDNSAGSVDSQIYHQDVKLSYTNAHKISSRSKINYNIFLEGSNRKHFYHDIKVPYNIQGTHRDYLYLNELYYTLNTEKFDLQFGKKIIKFGKGFVYSPTDQITASDVSVPTSPVLLGNYLISLDYYYEDWTLSAILFPIITPNKRPAQNARWTNLYNDINFTLEDDFSSASGLTKKPIIIKLEGTKYDTDWMFVFFNGANPSPVIRNDITVNADTPSFKLVQEYSPITFISTGFSTTISSMELHGEALMQNADEGRDDSFYALMTGGRYTFDEVPKLIGLKNIDVFIEYGKEILREAQSYPFYVSSTNSRRIYQNSIMGSFVFNVTDRFSINFDFNKDMENDGLAVVYGLNYLSAERGNIRVRSENYSGNSNSLFGKWDKNDNINLEYQYLY